MDHIPYPPHLSIPPVVVPYIQTYSSDDADFATFEERLKAGFMGLSAGEYAGFAQAWLYFGFLEIFIGEKIDKKRFLRRPTAFEAISTEYVLDSSQIPSLLNGCVRRFRKAYEEDRAQQLQRWKSILRVAQQHILQVQLSYRLDSTRLGETSGAVFLSINVLEATLRDFYFRMDYVSSAKEKNWGAYPIPMNKRMPGFKTVLQYGYHDQATAGSQLLLRCVRHNIEAQDNC